MFLNSWYQRGSFCSTSFLSISLLSPLSWLQARASLSLIIWLILYKLVVKATVLGRFKFQQNPIALIQQILTSRRFIGFFTDVLQTIFYSRGVITLLSSYSIFYKLSFWSIHLVQHLIFLTALYSYIGPKLASLLLTSQVFSAGGAILVVQGQRSIQTCYGLSCTSFLKAWSLYIASAQQTVSIYSYIRFSIIMLISFIKGVRGKVLGQTSHLLRTSSCKPREASLFFFKIILWLPRSVIRKGILYYLCPSTQR